MSLTTAISYYMELLPVTLLLVYQMLYLVEPGSASNTTHVQCTNVITATQPLEASLANSCTN